MGPQPRWRRDHIEMPEQEEWAATGPIAMEAGRDRTTAGERLHHDRRDACVGEQRLDMAGGADLVARRVHGRDTDEVAEILDQSIVGSIPGRRIERGGWARCGSGSLAGRRGHPPGGRGAH